MYCAPAAFAAGAPFLAAPPPAFSQQQPTPYQRLGGYDALAIVTDDFIGRLASDPQLKRFFVGHDKEGVTCIRQLVIDFLCAATGGSGAYTGQDMKTAHTGLGITGADRDASVKNLVAKVDKFHAPEREKEKCRARVLNMETRNPGKVSGSVKNRELMDFDLSRTVLILRTYDTTRLAPGCDCVLC